MSKNTDEDLNTSVSSSLSSSLRPWETMPSVLLGTWERRPQTSSQRDRDTLFDNSAAFVRACFPAQVSMGAFCLVSFIELLVVGVCQGGFGACVCSSRTGSCSDRLCFLSSCFAACEQLDRW